MMNKDTKVSWSVVAGFMALTLLTVSASLNGCTTADSREASGSSTPLVQMTNSEMEEKVKAIFNSDAQLKAANLSVYANVDHNAITLSGVVESKLLRIKAVNWARTAQPGLIVIAKIDVKPGELSRTAYTKEDAREELSKAKERGETVGDSLDDGWIHTRIVAQLAGNSTMPERKISVDVTNNAVTLRGMVETAEQKTEAERVAQNTEGVKSVNNQLKVGSATEKKS